MRLISQDRDYDIPYKQCVLLINPGNIHATLIGNPEKQMLMAVYSTQEKVQKAIQMLHEYYTGMNIVFRFPQEDKV